MFHVIRRSVRQTSLVHGNNLLIRYSWVSSKFNSTINIAQNNQSKCLTIEKGCHSMKYHYFWLRDHCRCNNCYNHITAQRKVNILQISNDIKPETVHVDSNEVLRVIFPFTVSFTKNTELLPVSLSLPAAGQVGETLEKTKAGEDGHKSKYALSWLEACIYENYKKTLRQNHKLWTKDEVSSAPIARVNLKELLESNACLSLLISSLVRYGVAFVENVASIEETEAFSKRIGPVKNTLFGQMWEFADSLDHSDTAYTKESLEPHTDNSYFSEASGLLILHCLSHDGTGGENTLVDGFKAAQLLKEGFPDVFDRLKSMSAGAEYLERGQHHLFHAPAIQLNPVTEDIEQIRFNEYDRAPLILPYDKISQYYQDLATLTKIIKNPVMIWKFKLSPGNAMVIDNFRLLHGRAAYTGIRKMCGCYIGRSDYLSKRMLFVNEN